MKMVYKIEELTFFHMKKRKIWVDNPYANNRMSIYDIEKTLSEEEKLAFIDELKEGLGTYVLKILKKWESEKDSLPKNQFGSPKTVSKKAWIKRNDPHKIIDIDYKIGTYYLFKTKFKELSTICPSTASGYSMHYTGESIVHQWFHDLCEELYFKEKRYFEEHDTKEIKIAKVKNLGNRYGIVFNNKNLNDIIWNGKKDVTEEELDAFTAAYEELEQKIHEISSKLEKIPK